MRSMDFPSTTRTIFPTPIPLSFVPQIRTRAFEKAILPLRESIPVPNYDSPHTRAAQLTIFGSVFVFAAALAVGLHFYAHFLTRRTRADEAFIAIAFVRASQVSNRQHARMGLESTYLGYTTGMDTSFRRVLHMAMFAVSAICPITLGLNIPQCKPVRAHYAYPTLPGSKCRPEGTEMFGTGIASAVCDAVLVLLPTPVNGRMRLSSQERIQAISLLAVGLVATVASVVRSYHVWALFHSDSIDASWQTYPIYIATDAGFNLGIICACAPHIRPLVKYYLRFGGKPVQNPVSPNSPQPDGIPVVASLASWKG
ncbi:hypothetical protein EJ08DRAFT_663682 [Tothia fuscella]|uniref:Rhodopsin domain-containing protein n=1 Tax=Tothia fuscella TaxID=1048955 RepID=A0A9P4TV95_9PEZI|nr:hypothetical protein EJ08DRAFT_663682 [Tothia fuscella]